MMKKYILISVISAMCLFVLFKGEIKSEANSQFAQYINKQEAINIGELLSSDLRITNKQMKEVDVKVISDKIVLAYKDGCPPCNEALIDISKHTESHRFAVVAFEEMPRSLEVIELDNLYLIDQDKSDTIFRGMATPTFFVFDKSVLVKKDIGYAEGVLDDLLSSQISFNKLIR